MKQRVVGVLLAQVLLALLLVSCASPSPSGPVTPMTIDKARRQQEAHYVELLHLSMKQRRPDPITSEELLRTLMALAEIDPEHPPADVEERLLRTQTEVLQRYDPQLLQEVQRRRQQRR